MKQILWHDAAKELPIDGQEVACISKSFYNKKELNANLAHFENNKFWKIFKFKGHDINDESEISIVNCKCVIDDVITWADAQELFSSANHIINKI